MSYNDRQYENQKIVLTCLYLQDWQSWAKVKVSRFAILFFFDACLNKNVGYWWHFF